MLLSIILPIYNEELIIPILYDRLMKVLIQLTMDKFELIFIDDGSKDGSLLLLQKLQRDNEGVKIIVFSRNFGHQAAISAGIAEAGGDILIMMDSDLQDPPELILEMVQAWRNGYDVVHATRRVRNGETWLKKVSAALYYRIMRLVGVNILADTGDFRLITREVAEALKSMPEKRRFLRGMVPWVGFKQGQVYYDRDRRLSGKSNYSLRKMLHLAGDGIFSFTTGLPKIPFILALLALLLQHWDTAMILVSLGIIAEYALRIYDEVRGRPQYLLCSKANSSEACRIGERNRGNEGD